MKYNSKITKEIKMKTLQTVFIVLIITLIAASVQARSFEFNGGGGFMINFYNPDIGFLHDKIQSVTPGFDKIEGPLLLWGGLGYGQVSDHWRIGGFGFGGAKEISGTFPYRPDGADTDILRPQDVELAIGGGGFYVEYIAGHLFERLEGALSLGIGGAGVEIKLAQYNNSITWDDLFDGLEPETLPGNFSTKISNGGFLLHPGLGVKYYITDFFAIEARASYVVLLFMGDWEFEEVKIRNTPDIDFNAPSFAIRFIFGG